MITVTLSLLWVTTLSLPSVAASTDLCHLNWNSEQSRLSFSGDGLTEIPNCVFLSPYNTVEKLYLDLNSIKVVPAAIGNLGNLTHLYLTKNLISVLPAEIGNLLNLKGLYLTKNLISVLPAEIGNLLNLKYLDLDQNRISVLPAAIGNLLNLNYLRLDWNRIEVLPDSIGDLKRLYSLKLNRNRISVLPAAIGNLLNLKYLYLNHNRIEVLPDSIGDLKRLYILSLYDNDIKTLPVEFIEMDISRVFLTSFTDNTVKSSTLCQIKYGLWEDENKKCNELPPIRPTFNACRLDYVLRIKTAAHFSKHAASPDRITIFEGTGEPDAWEKISKNWKTDKNGVVTFKVGSTFSKIKLVTDGNDGWAYTLTGDVGSLVKKNGNNGHKKDRCDKYGGPCWLDRDHTHEHIYRLQKKADCTIPGERTYLLKLTTGTRRHSTTKSSVTLQMEICSKHGCKWQKSSEIQDSCLEVEGGVCKFWFERNVRSIRITNEGDDRWDFQASGDIYFFDYKPGTHCRNHDKDGDCESNLQECRKHGDCELDGAYTKGIQYMMKGDGRENDLAKVKPLHKGSCKGKYVPYGREYSNPEMCGDYCKRIIKASNFMWSPLSDMENPCRCYKSCKYKEDEGWYSYSV